MLRGHYGRYHRGIVTDEFIQAAPSLSPVWNGTWDFTTNAFDPETLALADPARREIDPSFAGSYTDQFLFGIERELWKDVALAVHGTHKRGTGYGAWSDLAHDTRTRSTSTTRVSTPPASSSGCRGS